MTIGQLFFTEIGIMIYNSGTQSSSLESLKFVFERRKESNEGVTVQSVIKCPRKRMWVAQ